MIENERLKDSRNQELEIRNQEFMEENGNKEKKRKNVVGSVLGGDVLQSKGVVKQVPLIVLLCLFGIVLVYNRYHIEDLSRQKIELQDEINYLRQKRIEQQKHFQETVKISQIAELLDSTGIGITAGPPYELTIEN